MSTQPPISEDDCAICGRWPEAQRSKMRIFARLPLQEEQICAECQVALWAGYSDDVLKSML
jgi:hypothetical protein